MAEHLDVLIRIQKALKRSAGHWIEIKLTKRPTVQHSELNKTAFALLNPN